MVLALNAPPAQACASCFGKSDSAMAKGMNAGIFTLLAVVLFVLGCFFVFMIYLARRSAACARSAEEADGVSEVPMAASAAKA